MTVLLKKPLKFLVVDDSRAIQAIVRRAIQHCGFEPLEIRTALDGEQALDIMESFVPDLIITDWHMPKVSGLEMLQALRQMGHKSVRVGFVTTERTPALLDQAISNGAMFIIHKPFNDAELAEVVMASVQDLAQPVDGVAITPPPEPAPAPIPPTEVPAAIAEPAEPISEAVMQQQLQTYLGKIPFRLIARDAMTSAKLTPTNLLGLFTAPGHKGVYAIGVLDTNAVCMIGGGAARKAPPEVRAAMEAGQPDETMLAKANEFFRLLAPALGESASPQALEVSLAKASIVKNSFAKLAEVLLQTEQRSDFRLSIPGYGEGRMAFFIMSAPL